jgi:hypothetical protein
MTLRITLMVDSAIDSMASHINSSAYQSILYA